MRTLQLLQEKNHFLEKFFSLNEKQILHMLEGHFDQIEQFYNQREDLMKIIRYVDAEVVKAEAVYRDINGVYTEMQKIMIKEIMRTKDQYVTRILEQDMQILALIDKAKSNIIKELQQVRKGKRAMTGYKSSAA